MVAGTSSSQWPWLLHLSNDMRNTLILTVFSNLVLPLTKRQKLYLKDVLKPVHFKLVHFYQIFFHIQKVKTYSEKYFVQKLSDN